MTRDDILKLDAGPELDRLVAEKVMGWKVFPYMLPSRHLTLCPPGGPVHINTVACPPKYSTDIAAAWDVVEKVAGDCCDLVLEKSGCRWCAEFFITRAYAPTAPLAICRAALLATLEE